MSDDNDIMDKETFQKFQKACCNGQFSTFLNTVKHLPLAHLEHHILRNMWLFYSTLLNRAFEDKKVSVTKLKSFTQHSSALGEVFLTLPLTNHAFWSLQALTGFYKGCVLSGIETDSSLFDKMLDKALLTPKEHMAELNTNHLIPLTQLCQTSTNEKLHRVARHYTQSLTEDKLKQCAHSVIFLLLPYVSFQINMAQWEHAPAHVQEFVKDQTNIQQAQRLRAELPVVSHASSRKI